ncbi:hypothetical protein BD413DRAFT_272894 [Trametes elegans]|nr:hypothetical protein BD413DRAFT_272894 [Trametes elegans]
MSSRRAISASSSMTPSRAGQCRRRRVRSGVFDPTYIYKSTRPDAESQPRVWLSHISRLKDDRHALSSAKTRRASAAILEHRHRLTGPKSTRRIARTARARTCPTTPLSPDRERKVYTLSTTPLLPTATPSPRTLTLAPQGVKGHARPTSAAPVWPFRIRGGVYTCGTRRLRERGHRW